MDVHGKSLDNTVKPSMSHLIKKRKPPRMRHKGVRRRKCSNEMVSESLDRLLKNHQDAINTWKAKLKR